MAKTKTLDDLSKEARRNYFKKWRKENPERVKKHNAAYWIRVAQAKQEAASHDTKTDD